MVICGVESTCDETSVGIVENGMKVISSVVSSSSKMHEKYGGIVPEVAAREQVKVIIPVIRESFSEISLKDIDAFAVAYGPGLVGSLIVGVETAKTLSTICGKPLVAVNHLIGHVYANWLGREETLPEFPAVALIVSGGHTDLLLTDTHGSFKWLGGTVDDAAGETFDKVARLLKLKYPGGPGIERISLHANKKNSFYNFPSPMINSGNFDFSFSGLKTSVLNTTIKLKRINTSQVAFEFQNSIIKVLVKKTMIAAKKFKAKSILVGGGVAANQELRDRIFQESEKNNLKCFFPEKKFSVDNGAMIASAAYFNFKKNDPLKVQATPSLFF